MILRSLSSADAPTHHVGQARPAYEVFLANQEAVRPPFLPIPQPTHAHLAGQLAAVLRPEVFGELPPEVIEAIRQHDYGWVTVDLAQLQSKSVEQLEPFPAISAEEAVPAWEASVHLAEMVSPLIGVLVNRHFCLLSDGDDNPLHIEFRRRTAARRKGIETELGHAPEDLDRWAAALGVCDLMSLYLCSGSRDPAEFPFCHPADTAARNRVSKTALYWEADAMRFTVPLFQEGARLRQSIASSTAPQKTTELSWIL